MGLRVQARHRLSNSVALILPGSEAKGGVQARVKALSLGVGVGMAQRVCVCVCVKGECVPCLGGRCLSGHQHVETAKDSLHPLRLERHAREED
jgi:hypothetical protein